MTNQIKSHNDLHHDEYLTKFTMMITLMPKLFRFRSIIPVQKLRRKFAGCLSFFQLILT